MSSSYLILQRICVLDNKADFRDLYDLLDEARNSGMLGTIRFIGQIPQWPNDEAIGIEWDDLNKGKNDGELDGKRFFKTVSGLKNASFIKLGKKRILKDGININEAIKLRYGDTNERIDVNGIRIGSKTIEAYGFEQLTEKQQNFKTLKIVDLDWMLVNNDFSLEKVELRDVEELSVGFGLLDNWYGLTTFLAGLKHLKKINLNGNRFKVGVEYVTLQHVLDISLAGCGLAYNENLPIMLKGFTSLKKLDLSNNSLKTLEFIDGNEIENLDLSYNEISILSLKLNKLKTLNLSNNQIKEITATESPLLEHIDLRYNEIKEWDLIAKINRRNVFPNLKSININHNAIFNEENYDLSLMQLMIYLPNVTKINGREYKEKERYNYEIYFVSKVQSGEIAKPDPIIWEALVKKHGLLEYSVGNKLQLMNKSNNNIITITIVDEETDKILWNQKVFSKHTTLSKLRGKISKKLKSCVLSIAISEFPMRKVNDCATLYDLGFEDNFQIHVRTCGGVTKLSPQMKKEKEKTEIELNLVL